MAIISITGMLQSTSPIKSNSKPHYASATSPVQSVAESSAIAKVTAAAQQSDVAYPTMESGGSNNTDYMNFGIRYNFSTGSPTVSSQKMQDGMWGATATCSATRTGEGYHLKMQFTLPSVTASNIQQAILKFNYTTNWSNGNYDIAVCAPESNDTYQSYYFPPSHYATKTTTNITSNTGNSKQISIDITDVLKSCKTNNKNWIILARNTNQATSSTRIYVDTNVTPTIEYTLATSACNPPTNIINNGSEYFVPGGNISISWSGASAGTGNSIVGYRIYWKKGAEPIVGASDGYYQFESTSASGSVTFNSSSSGVNGTFPSASDRGSAYYFKMTTRGSELVNNAYYSSISVNYVAIKINSLPQEPSISVDKTRIKSTGSTTVNFIVAPGNDNDTEQTKMVRYSTSVVTPTIENTILVDNDEHALSPGLSAATTYYFWTYDGYEFSNNYTSQNIRLNIPPTIGSVTMGAVQTFLPSTRNGYVKNINGSANNITKDNEATLSYQWKLQVGSSASATTYSTTTNISTATSLTNIDVTSYGATFNTAYRLALTVTDDLGDYATGYSSTIYAIPAAPTITFYNQYSNSNLSTTNSSHFGTNVRFKYSTENTGIDNIELWYKLSNDTNYIKLKDLNRNESNLYSNTTLNELAHGSTYNFKIRFKCNNASFDSDIITRTRSSDITPSNVNILPASGTYVKPYTHTNFNLSFSNQPTSFSNTYDVNTSFANIYTIKFQNNAQNLIMSSSGSDSSGTVTGTISLNDKTTANWSTLVGSSTAPNGLYSMVLTITATNNFGEPFSSTVPINLDFIESIVSGQGTTTLKIKTDTSTYTAIPTATYTSSNRYPLFETQEIQILTNGIQCYANQNATLYLMQGQNILGSTTISNSSWTAPTGNSHIYTLSSEISLIYVIPKITTGSNIDYTIKIVLENGKESLFTNGLNICKYCKFNTSEINFSITNVSNGGVISWSCTNFGSNNITSKTAQFYTSSTLTNNFNEYTALGNSFTITTTSGTQTRTLSSNDIIYYGVKLTINLDFKAIGSANPIGTKQYIINLTNLYTYYNAVPNLGYGKNFFFLNANTPGNNNDGVLYIHEIGNRNKIYFGNGDIAEFEITGNGLLIDGGSW